MFRESGGTDYAGYIGMDALVSSLIRIFTSSDQVCKYLETSFLPADGGPTLLIAWGLQHGGLAPCGLVEGSGV